MAGITKFVRPLRLEFAYENGKFKDIMAINEVGFMEDGRVVPESVSQTPALDVSEFQLTEFVGGLNAEGLILKSENETLRRENEDLFKQVTALDAQVKSLTAIRDQVFAAVHQP